MTNYEQGEATPPKGRAVRLEPYPSSSSLFIVKSTTNLLMPLVGLTIRSEDVQVLIDDGVNVVIVARK